MEHSNASLINDNSNTVASASALRAKLKFFRKKKIASDTPPVKKSQILWHTDSNGKQFRYNLHIADLCGLYAAMIAEECRYWAIHNVYKSHKNTDQPKYSMYRRGHEMAEKFGIAPRTYWRALKVLKDHSILDVGDFHDFCGKMNIYILTKKYFDVAGIETITRIEREIFYPNKEDVEIENNQECQETSKAQIDTPINPELTEKWHNLCAKMAQGLCHKEGDFLNETNELSNLSVPPNIDIPNTLPPTPIETPSEKMDFEETCLGVCETEINQEKMLTPEAQEFIKVSVPKKRMPNERKKPLKAERKVRSAQRIDSLEQFEEFHGFSSSLCRDKHEEFFKVYPKKVDQEASARAFIKLLFSREIAFDDLMKRVKIFAQSEKVKKCLEIEEGRFIKNPANWLWDKVWKDIQPEEPKKDFENKKQEDEQKIQGLIDAQPQEVQLFLQEVTQSLSRNEFLAWFDRASWKMEQDKIVLNVPSLFACKTIAQKFNVPLGNALKKTSVNLLEMRACNAQGHLLAVETLQCFLQGQGE